MYSPSVELGIADSLNKAMAARGQILTEELIRPSGLGTFRNKIYMKLSVEEKNTGRITKK